MRPRRNVFRSRQPLAHFSCNFRTVDIVGFDPDSGAICCRAHPREIWCYKHRNPKPNRLHGFRLDNVSLGTSNISAETGQHNRHEIGCGAGRRPTSAMKLGSTFVADEERRFVLVSYFLVPNLFQPSSPLNRLVGDIKRTAVSAFNLASKPPRGYFEPPR